MAYHHHHRPLTGIYGDNYRYGTSLYNNMDVEKNYRNSLAKTKVRSDRGDLGLYTFAGSNVHGGTPAADRGGAGSHKGSLRGPNSDLYSPIDAASYGPGYYDSLRAKDREPRLRTSRPDYGDLYADEPVTSSRIGAGGEAWVPSSYQTGPSKIFDAELSRSSPTTTTKTTKTTEYWVPLTTHIYNTPYHTYYYKGTPFSSYTYRTADDLYSYNYVDDYKRSTTTKTTKNIDALDLSITSRNYEKMDYGNYVSKCRDIQCQLDEVSKCVYEAETKLKNDVIGSRRQMEIDLAEVAMIVDDTAKYNDDLHRVIRKQAKQISALSKQYDSVNTTLSDISDSIEKSRVRCQTLQSDLSSVKSNLELAMKRRY